MSIMGWVWLLVPLRVCGYHLRMVRKRGKVRVAEELASFPIEHLSKSRCVRKLESCASFSPFRGVCPVVERTGLGSLCLSERRRVPRMCVGAVKRVIISEKFR